MKTIVLVEDDEAIRDTFSFMLDKTIYHLQVYLNGTPILTNEVEIPDLFILDKNISGVSGLEVCRFIKSSERYRHVPVMMLSASPDIVNLARAAGADDAIEKPFSVKTMKETISRYT